MGKTDYNKLNNLSKVLEIYANENCLDIKKCSQYQWNLSVVDIILSVYPGSGLIYATNLHYTNTSLIDKTGEKYYFNDKKSMINQLNKIIFAVDLI